MSRTVSVAWAAFVGYALYAGPLTAQCSDDGLDVVEAEAHGDVGYPDSFSFALLGYQYDVARDGYATRVDQMGDTKRFDLLTDEPDGYIKRVYALAHECDLIVFLEIDLGGYGGSFATRVSNESLLQQWVSETLGFNLISPLVDDQYAYMAAFGSVGKLDMGTGAFVWRHSGLYDPDSGAFNIFGAIAIRGDTVVFQDGDFLSRSRVRPTIRIDRNSGRRMENRKR